MGVGLSVAAEGKTLLRRKADLATWLGQHDIAAHVPVDSPAANWSMCRATRNVQPNASVVHLVGPQLWAWAEWRIRRLRKLTDHVMCLLPFEPAWFGERGVSGTFVGHPLFTESANAQAKTLAGRPKQSPSRRKHQTRVTAGVTRQRNRPQLARHAGCF